MPILRELDIRCWPPEEKPCADVLKNCCCIPQHYLYHLPRIKTKAIWKIILAPKLSEQMQVTGQDSIVLSLQDDGPKVDQVRKGAGGVAMIGIPFDFEKYRQSTPEKKKEILLDMLHDTLVRIAKDSGWEIAAFQKAYEGVRADGLDFIARWGKKWSPSRRRYAVVEYRFGLENIELYMIVTDKSNQELARQKLTEFPATAFALAQVLSELAWRDEHHVRLTSMQSRSLVKYTSQGVFFKHNRGPVLSVTIEGEDVPRGRYDNKAIVWELTVA